MWRGFGRSNISVSAPFVWRCLSGSTVAPCRIGEEATPRPPQTRTSAIDASGSRTRPHAFARGRSRPIAVKRTSPKCP